MKRWTVTVNFTWVKLVGLWIWRVLRAIYEVILDELREANL